MKAAAPTPPGQIGTVDTERRRQHLATIGRATQFQPRNQKRRIYPAPPDEDDTAIALKLTERRDQIVRDLGGPDHISTIKLGAIERYCVLELHVETWESFFRRAGFVTRQGRVRSGYAGGYLASVTHLMRLAQIIGLDKVVRPVFQSPREWLEATANAAETSEAITTEADPDPNQQGDDE